MTAPRGELEVCPGATARLEILEGRLASLKQSVAELALEQHDLKALREMGDARLSARGGW